MTRTILFVGGALVALAFLAGRRSASDWSALRALRAANDSLRISHPAFVAQQAHTDTVVRVERASATAYIRLADSLKRVAAALCNAGACITQSPERSVLAANTPSRPAGASDTLQATGSHPTETEAEALRGALAAQEAATAALTVALDTMTAARDSAVGRAAQAERVAAQGLTVARGDATINLGLFRVPRPPQWLSAVVGCAGGAYLDRQEPLRGCGLTATGLLLVVPTR